MGYAEAFEAAELTGHCPTPKTSGLSLFREIPVTTSTSPILLIGIGGSPFSQRRIVVRSTLKSSATRSSVRPEDLRKSEKDDCLLMGLSVAFSATNVKASQSHFLQARQN